MRFSTTTICLFVFLSCLPAMAQEQIAAGSAAPVPTQYGQKYTTAQTGPEYIVPQNDPSNYVSETNPSAQKFDYDPANYNQWDPKNPETLYPAPGPEPTPPMGPCDQRTGHGYWCPKNWYVKQDVRIMYHPTSRGHIYSRLYDPYIAPLTLRQYYFRNEAKSGSLKMEPSAGYDITIGKYLGRDADNRDQFIEFTYYGLNNWRSRFDINATSTISIPWVETEGADPLFTTASGNLFSMFGGDSELTTNDLSSPVSGFNRADSHRIEYDSRWDNFELNIRIKPRKKIDQLIMHKNAIWTRESQQGWFCSYLLGVRGVSLDEYFAFYSSGTIQTTMANGTVLDPQSVGGRYITRTRNDMFGLQIGLDCSHQKGPWQFGADIKTGVFINFADNHTRAKSWGASYETPTGGDPWASEDVDFQTLMRSRDLASIAELGFSTSYQLRRNMTVNLAYDLSWIHGLALAPEQFIPVARAPDRINHNGALMMQSLSMGLELVW